MVRLAELSLLAIYVGVPLVHPPTQPQSGMHYTPHLQAQRWPRGLGTKQNQFKETSLRKEHLNVISVSHLCPQGQRFRYSSGCPTLVSPLDFHFLILPGHRHRLVSENQMVMMPILLTAAPPTSTPPTPSLFHELSLWASQLLRNPEGNVAIISLSSQ